MATPSGKGGGLALIEQQLAQSAATLRSQINQPSANRLSINENGDWVGADGIVLGPEIDLVVIDFISANRYYPRPYNPKNPEPPVCFAFGRILHEMAPEESAPEKQATACKDCQWNEYKSDARGVGKACKNTREIAVITHDQWELPVEEQKIMTYSVPPTAIKSFDGAVSYALNTYSMPPIKVILRASAIKQPSFVTASFAPTGEANPMLEGHFQRIPECEELLYRIPDLSNYVPAKKPAGRATPSGTSR